MLAAMVRRLALAPALLLAGCLHGARPAPPPPLACDPGAARGLSVALAGPLESTVALEQAAAAGPGAGRALCVEITDVSDTVACFFADKRTMNLALERASTFIETRRGLQDDLVLLADGSMKNSAGHDLRGADLRRFRAAWEARHRAAPALLGDTLRHPGLAVELDFWRGFLSCQLDRRPELILLAVVVDHLGPVALAHEVLHARFFRDPAYRAAALAFWREQVSAQDRERFRASYADTYNSADEELLANEFQAYALMGVAWERISAGYHDRLCQALAERRLGAPSCPR
jgi:hypothetical protein